MSLSPPEREVIRSKLLLALTSEGTANVRNKTSDAVSEIARQYVEEGEWNPEIWRGYEEVCVLI
jgi:hypothetical protein